MRVVQQRRLSPRSLLSHANLVRIAERFPVPHDVPLDEHRRELPGLLVLGGSHLLQQRGHAGRVLGVLLQHDLRFLDLFSRR